MVGTQLHHRKLVLRLEAQQGERHPHFIVEVAGGGQHLPLTAQDGGRHLLHRGLATAAGDGQHFRIDALAHQLAEATQSLEGIGHHQLGDGQGQLALHQQGRGPCLNGLVAKIVGVETLATQRDEQRPLAQSAGVGTDCRDLVIAADQTGIEHLRQVGKPEGHHLNDSINVCKAAATVSRSL
ncbi:hypothetical protein D3C72_581430 [compost metagenome]